MRSIVLALTLTAFFGVVFLSACDSQEEAKQSESEVTSADVKKEAEEALQTAKAFTQQQKDEYMQQMQARIDKIEKEIQEVQAKAQSKATELKEDSKAKFDQSMAELRSKKQAAADKLAELKSSSDKAWNDIKIGMDSAMDELSQALDKARSHFEEG